MVVFKTLQPSPPLSQEAEDIFLQGNEDKYYPEQKKALLGFAFQTRFFNIKLIDQQQSQKIRLSSRNRVFFSDLFQQSFYIESLEGCLQRKMENIFLEGPATQRRTECLAESGREGKAVAPKAWPAWRFVGNEIGESLERVRPPEKFRVPNGAGVAGLMELRGASPSPHIRLYGPAPRRAWLCLPDPSRRRRRPGPQRRLQRWGARGPKAFSGSEPRGHRWLSSWRSLRAAPTPPLAQGRAEEERGDA